MCCCVSYRSHNGILRLARSVVHLLYHFFKGSVDVMDGDRGEYEGSIPLVVVGNEAESWPLLFQSQVGRSMLDFGAEQAILVRNDQAKEVRLCTWNWQ